MFEKAVKHQKECPVCGTINALIEHPHETVWLDGQPKLQIAKYLEQYAMCDKCGCIYRADTEPTSALTQLVNSEKYQLLREMNCNTTLKKLMCMQEYSWGFGNVQLLLAHYYDEINEHDNTQQALQDAINTAKNSRFSDTRMIHEGETNQFKVVKFLMLQPELYLVDMYRRASQFELASKQIAELRARSYFGKPINIMNYLACEEDLIKAKDTQRR